LEGTQGDLDEAQALLEAAIASGHPRSATMAQASLGKFRTGESHIWATGRTSLPYETLDDVTSTIVGRKRSLASRIFGT
jgi:hypothetical protein